MQLTEVGESRIRGYLFVLSRSLRSFLPPAVADDAVREVESHIRERIEQVEARDVARSPAEAGKGHVAAKAERERAVVEKILAELGPPLRVAQAYSHEMTLDEAVTTGRVVAVARALWHAATTSVLGFLWGFVVLIGWAIGIALLAIAVLKPVFPNNVGLIVTPGGITPGLHVVAAPAFSFDVFSFEHRVTFGALFPLPPGSVVHGGYWVIPIAILAGLFVLVLTHRGSRRMLGWLRSRTPPGRLRLRLTVESN